MCYLPCVSTTGVQHAAELGRAGVQREVSKLSFDCKRSCFLTQASQFRFLDRLFIGLDGNFRLQRLDKREDPNDRSLAYGRSYFAETEELNEYLKNVGDEIPVSYSI